MLRPIDTFTDTDPKELPEEIEAFIRRNDRRYLRWFRTLFRLGFHYGYIECLQREPARMIIQPRLKSLSPEDLDIVFSTLVTWSKKKVKDPSALIQSLKASGLVIVRPETLDFPIGE